MSASVLITYIALTIALSSVAPAKDPRIEKKEYTEDESTEIIAAFNGARGEQNDCLFGFINDYKRDVYNYCIANDLSGGEKFGCERMMGFGLHEGVLEAGLEKCDVELKNSEAE
ncbi:MAG: hypothetical protein MRY72_03700 [Aquisalinus sp.]|nr:hypothetical protein [Aquisalinus sp.]